MKTTTQKDYRIQLYLFVLLMAIFAASCSSPIGPDQTETPEATTRGRDGAPCLNYSFSGDTIRLIAPDKTGHNFIIAYDKGTGLTQYRTYYADGKASFKVVDNLCNNKVHYLFIPSYYSYHEALKMLYHYFDTGIVPERPDIELCIFTIRCGEIELTPDNN